MEENESGKEVKRGVDAEFFDLEMYAICRAISEIAREKAWEIVWRAGEIMYDEIRSKLGLDDEEELLSVLKKIAKWLKDVGYIEDIEVREVSPTDVEYLMLNPVIEPGAKRLIEKGYVPAHISTSLMFAAIKQFKMKAEIVGEPKFLPKGYVKEIWKLMNAKNAFNG